MMKLTFSIVLCIIVLVVHTAIALPVSEEGSVVKNSGSKLRILGGTFATNGKLPWMVLIYYTEHSTISFGCGGSIISKKHVLTAAHCIQKGLSFVRVGEYDQRNTNDGKHQDIPVKTIFQHNQFKETNADNDIAILLLRNDIQFNNRIKLIRLNILDNEQFIHKPVVAAGWGDMIGGVESASMILKQVKYVVLPGSSCYIYRPNKSFDDSKQICAADTHQGHGPCQGDSGGPLMWTRGGVTYQIGIGSYGPKGCNTLKAPNVFTSVAAYSKWINQTMQYQ